MSVKMTKNQCAQIARSLINFSPFTTVTIYSIAQTYAKLGSKFCQILNKLLKIVKDINLFAKVT